MTDRSSLHLLVPRARVFAFATFVAAAAGFAHAQVTNVVDGSALHPPTGARVAIVEFDDLECPACAHANPTLKAAADKYHIPWIRHDMLIPSHIWSRNAAIYARWFDAQGHGLGDTYRDTVFASQNSIYNVQSLDQFTQNFAHGHGIALPFNVDPQNKLAGEVDADNKLSLRTGIGHTPTIFIATSHSKGAAYIEVQKVDTDLYRIIDEALEDTKPEPAASKAKPKK
ncbi:MAG TPA: thioredoxin domain-containing protein [Terracidiphilus sp.]